MTGSSIFSGLIKILLISVHIKEHIHRYRHICDRDIRQIDVLVGPQFLVSPGAFWCMSVDNAPWK